MCAHEAFPKFQIVFKVGFPKTLNKEEAHVC